MTTTAMINPELQAALDRLFSLQTFGIKLGLEPVTRLLEAFGNPHHRFPVVHVAGTNGKGSVCAMVASILRAAGLRVGLYTSPHLIEFAERIRVDGVPIDEERLAGYAREMMPVIEELGCTFFEGTTAMGFRYFAEQNVDVAVIETGMGGRLDATNVVTPLVSAITSISFDHTQHLGNTLRKIACEKAGIIKSGAPAVIGSVTPSLRKVFEEKGSKAGAPVLFVEDFCRAIYHSMSFDETVASYIVGGRELPRLHIGLVGRHQIENGRVALGVIEQLRGCFGITDEITRAGMLSIRENTGIRGRFDAVSVNPRIIIDVAHNGDGARVLVDTLRLVTGGRPIVRFVYGAVEDKDIVEIARTFRPLARMLYAVRADNHRSLPAAEIVTAAEEQGLPTKLAGDVARGIELALADTEPDEVIVVCGSFYVVGEALNIDALMRAGASHESHHAWSLPQPADTNRIADANGDAASRLDDALPGVAGRRLTVKHWSPSEQPRERLMKLGPRALSEAELLAILLRTGRKGEDVIQVSRNILHLFGSLKSLASRDYRELQRIEGIGPAKAVTLTAAFEIGRRMEGLPFHDRPTIESPADVASIYIPLLRDIHKEQFHVLILNTANKVVRMQLVSEGNLNSSIVHPREVFRTAIVENAAALIGLHNHPSGNPAPSKEDIAITKQLVDAGKIVGIPFHDHIIIAGENYVSLAEQGYV